MARHSGLQKQVLSLYRRALREAFRKDQQCGHSEKINVDYVRKEFREGSTNVNKNDFRTIEYMVRQTEKKIDLYSDPNTKGVTIVKI